MINVESIYQRVRELSTKGKGGYTSTTEFNRNSLQAEQLLWQYYAAMFERDHLIPAALHPFMTEAVLALNANGRFTPPANCGHVWLVWYRSVTNSADCGSQPSASDQTVLYLKKEEEQLTLSSPIRSPSLARRRMYYTISASGQFQFHPATATGSVRIEYLRYPTYAVRGYTVDAVNDEENYNALTSTNYQWPEQETSNLIDLLLMFQGIVIRDSMLIQWAQNHKNSTSQIVQ